MKSTSSALFCAITVVAAAAAATLASSAVYAQTTSDGGLLRNKAGMTLYTFDKDAAGESRCYDGCATAWPPFLAADGAQDKGRLTVVARQGGIKQWAYDGKPLYTFAGDTAPGAASGDGSGGVWHVVRPGAAKATAAAQPSGDYKY